MSEEKQVEEKTENTPEEQTEEKQAETTPEENNQEEVDESQPDIDYKAELDKAKSIIAHKERVIKNYQSKKEDDDGEEDNNQFITSRLEEMEKKNQEELERFKLSVVEDTIDDEISSRTSNQDEAELIRYHLENSVKFDYTKKSVKEAVRRAWMLANERKLFSKNNELSQALTARYTADTGASESGQRISNKKPQYTNQEKDFLRRYGVEI